MASHAAVAHAWAHQLDRNKSGHNMFYEGNVVYSYGYHFPIANFWERNGPDPVILFNRNGYSASTAKHMSHVRAAIPPGYIIITVDDPTKGATLEDFEWHLKKADEAVQKSQRARTRGDLYLDEAERYVQQANQINDLFEVGSAVSLETLGHSLGQVDERLARAREQVAERERRSAEARFAEQAERRAAWLAGEANGWYGHAKDGKSALLRVRKDKLETSQGVDVPLNEAIAVFRFAEHRRRKGEAWRGNGKGPRVGPFRLDAVDAEGNIIAGCHRILWPEAERIAVSIGLLVVA